MKTPKKTPRERLVALLKKKPPAPLLKAQGAPGPQVEDQRAAQTGHGDE